MCICACVCVEAVKMQAYGCVCFIWNRPLPDTWARGFEKQHTSQERLCELKDKYTGSSRPPTEFKVSSYISITFPLKVPTL